MQGWRLEADVSMRHAFFPDVAAGEMPLTPAQLAAVLQPQSASSTLPAPQAADLHLYIIELNSSNLHMAASWPWSMLGDTMLPFEGIALSMAILSGARHQHCHDCLLEQGCSGGTCVCACTCMVITC